MAHEIFGKLGWTNKLGVVQSNLYYRVSSQ